MQETLATIRHVAPLEKRARGRHAQLVQLVVDGRFLLDVNVGGGNVGFRLVIVVVADEVFHRVLGKEVAKLVVKLRGQGLVVRQHQGGTIEGLHHLGHGKGFARTGNPQQHLMLLSVFERHGSGREWPQPGHPAAHKRKQV